MELKGWLDEIINLASYSILLHPLRVERLSEVLIPIELRDILYCLLPQHLVFLEIKEVLQSFSQVLLYEPRILLIAPNQVLYLFEFTSLCSQLNPISLHFRIQVYSFVLHDLLSNFFSHSCIWDLDFISIIRDLLSSEFSFLNERNRALFPNPPLLRK